MFVDSPFDESVDLIVLGHVAVFELAIEFVGRRRTHFLVDITMTTVAPSSTNRSAITLPIPTAPPVMITILPSSIATVPYIQYLQSGLYRSNDKYFTIRDQLSSISGAGGLRPG